jgi:hypothetical protein
MAKSDYRLCDVCDEKAFYDSNLSYEQGPSEYNTSPPFRIAGQEQYPETPEFTEKYGMRLGYLGDWAVLCKECAKTHRTQIAPIAASSQRTEQQAGAAEDLLTEIRKALNASGVWHLGMDTVDVIKSLIASRQMERCMTTPAAALPPLPEPYIRRATFGDLYLAKDMHAYGAECARLALESETRAEADRLRLHGAIMNLPCCGDKAAESSINHELAYKMGHRDARHAAAELVLADRQVVREASPCPTTCKHALEGVTPLRCAAGCRHQEKTS